jgi:hypothetical protein
MHVWSKLLQVKSLLHFIRIHFNDEDTTFNYRQNPIHKNEYSHPGDADYVAPTPGPATTAGGAKPVCQYGSSCYRKNPQHIRDFDHTRTPTAKATPGKRQRKAKGFQFHNY